MRFEGRVFRACLGTIRGMPFAIALDGTEIAYKARGTGPRTIILLHAWGVSGNYFDEATSYLDAQTLRAVTLDLRGHGESGKPDVPLTWDLLAADVLAVADEVGVSSFLVLGHSLGGKLAQYLAVVAAPRVEALMLVASPSAGELPAPDFVRAWTNLAGDGEALVNESVRRFLKREVPEEILARIASSAAKIPRIYLERTLHLVETTTFADRCSGISLPVLVLSTEDGIHSTQRDIATSFPQAVIHKVASSAEMPIEDPQEFARIIMKFAAESKSGLMSFTCG